MNRYTFRQRRFLSMVTAVICMVVVMVSCDESQLTELKAGHADSLIFAEGAKMHYDHMLKMTDSLEQAGDISPLIANRWRGVYYYRQNQYRMAELYYRKVLEGKIKFLYYRLGMKRFTLHVHPYVAAYLNEGLFSLRRKWQLRYGLGVKVIPSQKLAFLQYEFYDKDGQEIDVKEEIEIR